MGKDTKSMYTCVSGCATVRRGSCCPNSMCDCGLSNCIVTLNACIITPKEVKEHVTLAVRKSYTMEDFITRTLHIQVWTFSGNQRLTLTVWREQVKKEEQQTKLENVIVKHQSWQRCREGMLHTRCLTSAISVQAWETTCCLWGSMTDTSTKALGFLSLRPETTRSLQAGGREEPAGGEERREKDPD